MVDKIELPNLENSRLLKFLIAEGVDQTETPDLDGIALGLGNLSFLSSDKARIIMTKCRVVENAAISKYSMEQLIKCTRVLGKDSYVFFTKDKEYPVMVMDHDGQNVIALSPMVKET